MMVVMVMMLVNSGDRDGVESSTVDHCIATLYFRSATEKCIEDKVAKNAARMDIFCEQVQEGIVHDLGD